MILITGGAYSGKKTFLKEKWPEYADNAADGRNASFERLCEASCFFDFEEWIRRAVREQTEAGVPYSETELAEYLCENTDEILKVNPDVIIVLREMGCGIVPLDAEDRLVREMTGRVGCHLAAVSNEVWKLTCGIASRIK